MSLTGIEPIFLTALAVWGVVECWNHGSIFDRLRSYLQVRGGWIADLLLCPFCLSWWVGAALSAAVLSLQVSEWGWFWSVIHWPASVRLANLMNDLAYSWCRTPRVSAEAEMLEKLAKRFNDERAGKPPAVPDR